MPETPGLPTRRHEPGLGRRALHLLALDPAHAGSHLAIGFLAAGLAFALLVAVYALLGWDHIDKVQLDVGAVVWSGLIGTLVYNGLLEEIVFRGVIFRLLERGLGSIAALVLSSMMFATIHLLNRGASLMGAFVVAIGRSDSAAAGRADQRRHGGRRGQARRLPPPTDEADPTPENRS